MVKYKTFSQYYITCSTYTTIILGWLKKKASSPSPVEKIYLVGYISTFENIA